MILLLLVFSSVSQGAVCLVEPVHVREGEVGVLRCKLSARPGDGEVVVDWALFSSGRSSAALRGLGGASGRPVIRHHKTLLMLNATQRDAGVHACSLRNASGILRQAQFNLTVFRDHCYTGHDLYRVMGYVGESLSIPCPLSCNDVPLHNCNISWRKDCTPYSTRYTKDIYLESVTTGDAGNYTCTLSFSNGTQVYRMSATREVKVNEATLVLDPKIVQPLENARIEVDVGKPAVIRCIAVVQTEPEGESLSWMEGTSFVEDTNTSHPVFYNQTEELQTDGKYHMITELVFRNVSPTHLNTKYTCKLTSTLQVLINVSITLTQRDVPPSHFLWLGIVGGVCVVTASLLMVVYMKLRIDIVLFLRDLLQGTSLSVSDGKRYDAYIMTYKATEAEALTEEERRLIVCVLETEFGYRLCIYERDVLLGEALAEAVLENIKRSRRLLLLPSALEEGGEGEVGLGEEYGLLSGLHAALVDRQTQLVLVERPPGGEPDSLSEPLRLLARSGGTVAWTGERSVPLSSTFWKELRYHMPSGRCPRHRAGRHDDTARERRRRGGEE